MTKIAKRIDPKTTEPDLPDKPPGMHWSTYDCLAERHQRLDNVWAIMTLRQLGRFFVPGELALLGHQAAQLPV